MIKQKSLGVDFGNTIIKLIDNKVSFYENTYRKCKAMPYSINSLKKLNENFNGRVYIVSKCSKPAEKKILDWMKYNNFHESTGIEKSKVHFCRERKDKSILSKKLRLTEFVDDKLEVLSHMKPGMNLFLFRPQKKEVNEFKEYLSRVRIVKSWKELLPLLD